MHRRRFLAISSAAALGAANFFTKAVAETDAALYRTTRNIMLAGSPKPMRAISLAVDTVLPADPLVQDDFAATDYQADVYVASKLGYLGQLAAIWNLNWYSLKTSARVFSLCNEQQRLSAIRAWIHDRDRIGRISRDLLSGLLSLSVAGTFEGKDQATRDTLYAKMGWYDATRPQATYHWPCDGYSNLPGNAGSDL